MNELLEMTNISKSFPGVQALDNVSFSVKPGEVMALVGANGAGKSTLLKIVTGVHTRDTGEIKYMGKSVNFRTPEESKAHGIAAIYQELTAIPNLTVSENIFISYIKNKTIINYKKLNQKTQELLDELAVSFKPTDKVSSLTVAEQQMVEIARAITEQSKLLIMDEPTSALSTEEKNKLFEIARRLKKRGIGIVFVTHRLREIFELSDRVTVLKDGKLVGTYDISEVNEEKLVELMISRTLDVMYTKSPSNIGDVILSVKNIKKEPRVKDVSFDLRRGEILGLTGLLGSGRTEVARCIFGLDKPEKGEIIYKGEVQRYRSPYDAVKRKIALVPEDRKERGLVLNMQIDSNICLGSDVIKRIRNKKNESKVAYRFIDKLNIVCTSAKQVVRNLSGGNQQKVVFGKWLLREAEILILDEPTRGIDVSAKAEIYKIINDLAINGTSIILISSEIEEVIGMCDRAVILYEGTSIAEIDRSEFSEERIMQLSHNVVNG